MYKECAKLILYRNLGKDSILYQLSEIFRDFDTEADSETHLIERIYEQIKALLDLSTMYGFDDNLWHNYLTFILLMNENSFTLVSEKQGAMDGSVNQFALNDCKVFKALFDFDFSEIEASLDINCFSIISNYHAVTKKERMYNKNVSVMVRSISKAIEQAKDENEIFQIITDFYQQYGVGMFGLNKAFRIRPNDEGVEFLPINNMESVYLNDLVGYELQKEMLVENTKAFVNGKPANNVLLYGDAGTGKSTSIKAIVNEFYEDGLRMIEIYKHQFKDLSNIIAQIKNRNYRFIIYMDDLSFEEFEIEYKFLKAVIEGGVETKPDNVLIYATSNRRHLVKETWNDRDDMSDDGLHHSDTMQEKLSLVARFGLSICYEKPNQKNYFHIVCELAKKHPELKMSEEELCAEARKWELSHGGTSGRAAQQLINYLLGKVE
ncbi:MULTISPECIES: ATP-binding protein [Bacillota]|uniref:ATP-binding protein n=2 Tax=Amedibacillus TaxID=2749846 RepID=A0A7G9GLC8_9FIRM|nr:MULTISPECIES: ATP-binding protein [Bacillota]QNM11610.1 ATP-binding protein [[Eubacterium] hominis]MCH4285144.1 ATP-binding protein [Amedibacillus hominis]RGB56172.1 ATP-binding protein [Absiella sp. AM22-9]RGB61933.1 ATP-binding protein [Absiella sp. AM10-20]RGB70245.1 ATP-binding protein [Absiella sp. AM09-45]